MKSNLLLDLELIYLCHGSIERQQAKETYLADRKSREKLLRFTDTCNGNYKDKFFNIGLRLTKHLFSKTEVRPYQSTLFKPSTTQ